MSRRAGLSRLYRSMLRVRLAERKVAELYPTDKIQSPVHLSLGQEAVSAGLAAAMRPGDHLYATYRGHGPYLALGGSLEEFFGELFGKETGCARGRGGSMHLAAPERGLMACSAIVAGTIPVAAGDALAALLDGRRRATLVLFGDGAVDEGVFFETANFAVLKRLPLVFVLENNGYAIHSRVSDRHARRDLFRIAEGVGLRGGRHDGRDPELVRDRVAAALAEARAGRGPRLLEFETDRWCEHVGPNTDWDAPYRARGERAAAERRDPRPRAARALRRLGAAPRSLAAWEARERALIEAAVRRAEAAPFPDPATLLAGAAAP